MNRFKILLGFSLLALTSVNVAADCSEATQVKNLDQQGERNNLQRLLSGQTVCATRGDERWQEDHRSGGELWDYKQGPNDKMDPSKRVGTWSTDGFRNRTRVIYNYSGAGGRFVYTVHANGGNSYSFCGDSGEIVGTLQNARRCP